MSAFAGPRPRVAALFTRCARLQAVDRSVILPGRSCGTGDRPSVPTGSRVGVQESFSMVEHGGVSLESVEDGRGTVKWFDARKGFGFLEGPAGVDVFIHFSVIEQDQGFRTLRDGEEVLYSAAKGPKGWAATRVRSTRPREAPPA
jgi:CspA family cold shock protein